MKSLKEKAVNEDISSTLTLKGIRRVAIKLELGHLEMKETEVLRKYAMINNIKLKEGSDKASIIMKLLREDIKGFTNSVDDEKYFQQVFSSSRIETTSNKTIENEENMQIDGGIEGGVENIVEDDQNSQEEHISMASPSISKVSKTKTKKKIKQNEEFVSGREWSKVDLLDEADYEIIPFQEFATWQISKIEKLLRKRGTGADEILKFVGKSSNILRNHENSCDLAYLFFESFSFDMIQFIVSETNGNIKSENSQKKLTKTVSKSEFDLFLACLLLSMQYVETNKEDIFEKIQKLNPLMEERMIYERFDEILNKLLYSDIDEQTVQNKYSLKEFISRALNPFKSNCINLNLDNLNIDDLMIVSYSKYADEVGKVFKMDRKLHNTGHKCHVVATYKLGLIVNLHLSQENDSNTCSVIEEMLNDIKSHIGVEEGLFSAKWGIVDIDRGYCTDNVIQTIVNCGFQCFGIGSLSRSNPYIIEDFKNIEDIVKRKKQMENSDFLVPNFEQYGHDFKLSISSAKYEKFHKFKSITMYPTKPNKEKVLMFQGAINKSVLIDLKSKMMIKTKAIDEKNVLFSSTSSEEKTMLENALKDCFLLTYLQKNCWEWHEIRPFLLTSTTSSIFYSFYDDDASLSASNTNFSLCYEKLCENWFKLNKPNPAMAQGSENEDVIKQLLCNKEWKGNKRISQIYNVGILESKKYPLMCVSLDGISQFQLNSEAKPLF